MAEGGEGKGMHETDATPEEFADDIEETFWAAVTPAERARLTRDYQSRGREAIREAVDGLIRDDLADREEYVEAAVDAIEKALAGD